MKISCCLLFCGVKHFILQHATHIFIDKRKSKIIIIIIIVNPISVYNSIRRGAPDQTVPNVKVESRLRVTYFEQADLAEPISLRYKPELMSSNMKARLSHGHVSVDSVRGTFHPGWLIQIHRRTCSKYSLCRSVYPIRLYG